MNEQLLLSKAFWSIDEYNQAVANLLELYNRIEKSYNDWQDNDIDYDDIPVDRINATEFEIYLNSIVVFIESTPKYVGVFDSYHAPTYRGFNFGNCYEFFKKIFRTYCYISIFGKDFKAFEAITLMEEIKSNDFLKEYAYVYKIDTYISVYSEIMFFKSFCSEDDGYGYNESKYYDDTESNVDVFLPLLTTINSKIGYHKSYKCYIDFKEAKDTYGGFEKYISPIYELEEYKNLVLKYTKYNNAITEYDELEEKIDHIKEKLNNSETENKNLETKISRMQNQVDELESKFFGRKKAKAEAVTIREKIKAEIKNKEKNDNAILKLKEELTQCNERYKVLSNGIEHNQVHLSSKLNDMLQENMQIFDYEWEN